MSLVVIQWILIALAALGGLFSIMSAFQSTPESTPVVDQIPENPVADVSSIVPSSTIRGDAPTNLVGNDTPIPVVATTMPVVDPNPVAEAPVASSDSGGVGWLTALAVGAAGYIAGRGSEAKIEDDYSTGVSPADEDDPDQYNGGNY